MVNARTMNDNQNEDFGAGQHVLQPRHALHAKDIDDGEEQHQQAGDHLRPAERKFPIARTEQHVRVFQMQRRERTAPDSPRTPEPPAAMGAENPAKNDTQPVMNPQVGPKACVR